MKELKTQKDFIEALHNVYTEVDKRLPPLEAGNVCKSCFYCCTVRSKINASKLELDYLGEQVNKEELEAFVDFIRHKKDPTAKRYHLYFRCPFYDSSLRGCSVYKARPYSCRVLGIIDSHKLPEFCVYYNPNGGFPISELYDRVPALKEYRELIFRYDIFIADMEEEIIQAHLNLAEELFAQMRNVESLKEFKKVLELCPNHPKALEYTELLSRYEDF